MRSTRTQTSKASIEALLREFLPSEVGDARPAGCLISRSNAEQEDLTALGKKTANAAACQQRQIFLDILIQGQLEGEIGPHVDLEPLAWYYFGVLQSIVNLPSVGATSQTLVRVTEFAMLAWPQDKK